jgi:hypothetical protein
MILLLAIEYDTPATSDTVADRVFGQPNFTTNGPNAGGITASSLNAPYGVTVNDAGNLFIVDKDNNRVLEYDMPTTSDSIADRVFGQPNFTTNTANTGGITASSLNTPFGAAVDRQGNVFVADALNNRVLEYEMPTTSDTIADRVFGQPNFTTNGANAGGITASSLNGPYSISVDRTNSNLFIADTFNHRVLEYYNISLSHDTIADRVFGQPDFTTNSANSGGVSARSLQNPFGIALSPCGSLFVADTFNNRVLSYDSSNLQCRTVLLPLIHH